MPDNNKTYLNSEVEEILQTSPNIIIRIGIYALILITIIFLIITSFINVPSILNTKITIEYNIPMLPILSMDQGHIHNISISNESEVKVHQKLLSYKPSTTNNSDGIFLQENGIKEIISNYDGRCYFFQDLYIGKEINNGDTLFSILPKKGTLPNGVIILPLNNSSLIKANQRVIVNLGEKSSSSKSILKAYVSNAIKIPQKGQLKVYIKFDDNQSSFLVNNFNLNKQKFEANLIISETSLLNKILNAATSVVD